MSDNKIISVYPGRPCRTEFTVTSLLIGILLAIVFGAANAYLGLRVGMTISASYSGGGYFHGNHPRHPSQRLHSGKQPCPDDRFCR